VLAAGAKAYGAVGMAAQMVVDNMVRVEQMREARMKGYEGDPCGQCGNFTLVRNGTCLKCVSCGGTTGCS
jgi:ribonucleoside-diphosphate reductase alpha chain